MLKAKIIIVDPKIIVLFFFEKLLKAEVIFDFSVSLTLTSSSDEKIFNKDGNNKNVTEIETIKPRVIIQPKSIIGFIPLKISDRKAQIGAPVYSMELLGDASMVTMRAGGVIVAIKADKDYSAKIGDAVHASIPGSICHLFNIETGERMDS